MYGFVYHITVQTGLLRQHHIQMPLQQNGRDLFTTGGGRDANEDVAGIVPHGFSPIPVSQLQDPVAQCLLVAAAMRNSADVFKAIQNAAGLKVTCQIHILSLF